MARHATIIDQIADAWGDAWDVREYRPTDHNFVIAMGWPAGLPRGRNGSGGVRVIITPHLAAYLETMRDRPIDIALPIGRTTIKRLRVTLGHNWFADRTAWWEERVDDLSDLTIEAFAARHDVSIGAVANARLALYGPVHRPAGWWRAPEVAAIIQSAQPRAAIADKLGISVGTVGRLRWQLKSGDRDDG